MTSRCGVPDGDAGKPEESANENDANRAEPIEGRREGAIRNQYTAYTHVRTIRMLFRCDLGPSAAARAAG